MVDAATQIEQLRKYRQRRDRDLSIAPLIGVMDDDARRTQRRLGALIDLWSQLVPGELEKHSRFCPTCANELEQLRLLDDQLRGSRGEPAIKAPSNLWAAIKRRLET